MKRNITLPIVFGSFGCFAFFIGLVTLLARQFLASSFLGARYLFGMPLGKPDAVKDQLVLFAGGGLTFAGFVALVVAGILLLVAFNRPRTPVKTAVPPVLPRQS